MADVTTDQMEAQTDAVVKSCLDYTKENAFPYTNIQDELNRARRATHTMGRPDVSERVYDKLATELGADHQFVTRFARVFAPTRR